MSQPNDDRVTAAVLVIGDEILSGRTQDTNLSAIAKYLATYGVDLCEARVVPDVEQEIIDAVNALRTKYDYVITTGGIYGQIAKVNEESVQLQIANTVKIEIARAAIGGYQGQPAVVESNNQ